MDRIRLLEKRGWAHIFLCGAMLAILAVALTGCTRTVIAGYVDSPGQRYRVYGRVYGAYGRSFLDHTRKSFRISIVTCGPSERTLFRHEYYLQGADVTWNGTWNGDGHLTVVVYEAPAAGRPDDLGVTNPLISLTYQFDSKTGRFVEGSTK